MKSVTKPRFLTKSKERMVISTDIGIPRAKSSLGIKRMSFDLDRFNSTNLDIYLRAQPTSVQKAAGGKKKKGTVGDTLCIIEQSLITIYILIFPWSEKLCWIWKSSWK